MKTKYWTGCVNERGQMLALGMPFTNLRHAKAALPQFNSTRAAVVKADEKEKPTTDIVWRIYGGK